MQGLVSFAFFLAVAGTVIAAPSNADPNFVRSSENSPLNVDDLDTAMKGPFQSMTSKLVQHLVVPDSVNCIAEEGICNRLRLFCQGLVCFPSASGNLFTVSVICLGSFVVIEVVSLSCRANVLHSEPRKRGRDCARLDRLGLGSGRCFR